MKKILPYILILIAIIGLFNPVAKTRAIEENLGLCEDSTGVQIKDITKESCIAKGPEGQWVWTAYYYNLAPLPCTEKKETPGCVEGEFKYFDPTGEEGGDLGSYLNLMIGLFIGICAVLAVVMIVVGGIEYMTSELISGKAAGKERATNAIFGLLLALGAWTILNQINPDLLKTDLESLKDVVIEIKLVTLARGEYSSSAGGAKVGFDLKDCVMPPDLNNACHPTKFINTCFESRAESASRICNVESDGGEPGRESRSDKLENGIGAVYSVGLWQINLTAHEVGGLNCPDAFTDMCGPGTATPDKQHPTHGPVPGNCSVTIKPGKEQLYKDCVAAAKNIDNNIAAACKASKENGGGFKPWDYTRKKCGIK